MARHVFAVLNCALLLSFAAAEVPSYIQVCGRQNPNLDKCIENSVLNMKSLLKSGIPELDVPSLEPLDVEEIPLSTLDTFRAVATKVKLWELSNFQITYLKADLKNQKIDVEIKFPKVRLNADYDVKARILVPVSDKGPINIVTENVEAKATLKYQTVEKRGRKLIYFPNMTTKITIHDYEAVFAPGSVDNPLAQGINSVLANSRKELIENMTPNLEKAISKKILEVSNRICKHFTYDELFPNRP